VSILAPLGVSAKLGWHANERSGSAAALTRAGESLASADVLAPCVLWIDEIEKGFAAGDSDGGATRRVLGAFLTWLAEKGSRVFVVCRRS